MLCLCAGNEEEGKLSRACDEAKHHFAEQNINPTPPPTLAERGSPPGAPDNKRRSDETRGRPQPSYEIFSESGNMRS